jgi:diguanylate cyclase (GGDEF)-like protein/PAS domain S-box-containing protein
MNIGKYIELLGELFEPAYIVDSQRTILFWNKSAEKMTGYEASMVVGKKCDDNMMMYINDQGEKICMIQCPLKKSTRDNKNTPKFFYLQHKNGHRIPVEARVIPISNDDGAAIGVVGIFVKKGQGTENAKPTIINELVKAAYIDSVTNLPNKEYMENKVKTLLLEAIEKPSEIALGLLSIEVQNLLELNSRGGMAAGNLLLRVVATTLSGNVEMEEGSFVCKWYGGSFVVVMNTNRISTLLNWANKLKLILEKSNVPGFEDENIKVTIGGISVQPGEVISEVLKRLGEQLQVSKSQSSGISIT